MSLEQIAVVVSILAVMLQGLNGYLYLKIKNAILASEKATERWVDDEFVRKETCNALRHPVPPGARPSERYL